MNPGKEPDGIDDQCELAAGARLLRAIAGDDRAGGPGFERGHFRRGEIVYAIDDPAPGVHVIVSGRVKVYRLSEDGREIILGILGEGALFGEEALFADGRYDSIAETIEATETTFVANTVVLDTGLTHQQMAGLIGTTRETFTSTISRLAASQIVRPQRLRLEILDRGALHNFA